MSETSGHGICIQLLIISIVLLIFFTAIFVYGIFDTIKNFKDLTKQLQNESKKDCRSKLLNFAIKHFLLILLNLIPMLISGFLIYLSLSSHFQNQCYIDFSQIKNIFSYPRTI